MAMADSDVGQCLFPKTVTKKDGSLDFKKPINIYTQPNSQAPKVVLREFSAYSVEAESNGFVQLITVSDYDAPDPEANAGKILGWAKIQDFEYQALRNCN